MAQTVFDPEHELRQTARKRAQAKLSFLGHLGIYLVVNIILLLVNLLTSPGGLWFYWALLGWGIGLAAHGIGVYATDLVPKLLGRLEEGEMNRLRKGSSPSE